MGNTAREYRVLQNKPRLSERNLIIIFCCNMLPMADGCPPHYSLDFSFILLNVWTGNNEIEIFILFSMYSLELQNAMQQ